MPLCMIQADEKYYLYNIERIIQKKEGFSQGKPSFLPLNTAR